MGKRLPTVWAIEPHTQVKHKILQGYLDGWFPILTSWNTNTVYIDGFAGPGKYNGGEIGSPIIAIQRFQEAKKRGRIRGNAFFIFVEADKDRCEHLSQEVTAAVDATIRYDIRCDKYAEVMDGIWKLLGDAKATLAPTFAFIDPFGFKHTPFEHFERLLSNPSTEVLFTCMFEEVNRFIGEANMEGHLESFFGSADWRKLQDITGAEERKEAFREYFRQRLYDAGANYVLVFEMKNARNATDYFLFFATKNIAGVRVMKQAMYAADQTGGFSFSDFTYAKGPTLFVADPDYSVLRQQLQEHYSRKTDVRIEAIEEFVLAKTSFLFNKRESLALLERAGKITARKADGKRRNRNTFPPGTLVTFLE